MASLTDPGSMSVSQLIGDQVVRLHADATLRDVADTLDEGAFGAVVLGDDDRAISLVSERDLVRAIARGQDPATTLAKEVASTELIWCDVSSTVDEVAGEMLRGYVRHVLVEDNGSLVGIVSARDLLGYYCADSAPE